MSGVRTAAQIALGFFYELFMSLIAQEPHETDVIVRAIGFQSRILCISRVCNFLEGILSFADSKVRSKFDSAAVNAVLDANEAMMKFACTVRSICISVGFLVFSSLVSASDELIVYVFDNGVPVANTRVSG